ncbi:MAG TPA: two-component regulator propeller domain-containing protein [Prolixibacteraceae bacterium]|nr:two-component regulator propeller domain-containing protein [Prolixibacteraceae bacterium]
MIRTLLHILLPLLLFSGTGYSQSYKFRTLNGDAGLSSNQINTIFKDSKGFVWVGTVNGLNRFDGSECRIFRKEIHSAASIGNNLVNQIFEDHEGRLWVVTGGGLNIYDPITETFLHADSLMPGNIPIPSTQIVDLYTDGNQDLWIINQNDGLYRKERKNGNITLFPIGGSNGLSASPITGFAPSPHGGFWLLHQDMVLKKFDPENGKTTSTCTVLKPFFQAREYSYSLLADSDDHLWVYSRNENDGIYSVNPETGRVVHFHVGSKDHPIGNNVLTCAAEDQNGNILVGSDHGGLIVISRDDLSVCTVTNDPGDELSLAQNSITCMFRDNEQIIWIGTYKKGVSYYHPDYFRFSAYTQHPYRSNWLAYEDVNTFAEDPKGNLWIGTNGGGLIHFDRNAQTFHTYRNDPENPNSLSSNVIVDLCIDLRGELWIGTYLGGLNRFDGRKFNRYLPNPSSPNSLSDNEIWSVFEDSEQQLWIGTLGSGLEKYDRENDRFIHYPPGGMNSVHSGYIMAIDENIDGNIWFATANGVDLYDRASSRFIQFYSNNEANSISSNSTLDVCCDSRGLVWIATRDGLNMYDPVTQKITVLGMSDGLPDNNIVTILEDNLGNMWLGTPQGLCNLIVQADPFSFRVKVYDERDGLHGKEFNEHAALKTRKGELIFGGSEGFSIFQPENLQTMPQKPGIVFTGLNVQNKTIAVGDTLNKRVLLPASLNNVGRMELKHFEKTFSLSFAALNYFHPEKTVYHYRLDGFNDEWTTSRYASRSVTYTNLHPGDYIFRVYASDSDNLVRSDEITLAIVVKPPFWETKWAYSFYLILVLFAIFYSAQILIKRERNRFLIQQERLETAKIHEMDLMKIKFFTNISHEFRTPLTLILSPIEKIIKTTDNASIRDQLSLVHRNGRRLLNLVNQLLDFRKLEVQGLTLERKEEELIAFCREATTSFSDLSDSRNIQLMFVSNVKELWATFDYDKIEKIIFNLLSNAFKFTPEGGSIGVEVLYEEKAMPERQVRIRVSDTGIGIPQEKREVIFERFVQNIPEGARVNKGSGIGLSLTREFVQMHGGNIRVESEPGKGSCFEVILPLKDQIQTEIQAITAETINGAQPMPQARNEAEPTGEHLFRLLLVEDNPDIRFYLKDNLKNQYSLQEAANGMEAWDRILKDMPDLVVTDIMMEVMDGIELCRKIKTDNRTSHIPVILLTARSTDQQRYEGLETGADDYITKPFSFEFLELRIRMLIEQRMRLRKQYQQNFDLQPSGISITSLDEKFLQKIKHITETNMHEPDFSVEKLSSEFGISRAHLYNKLVALTGKTPIEFIRILRIRRAAQLLEKSQLTVMEIAYKVGFNDPRYFTKHFKNEYRMTPSQYAKKHFQPADNTFTEL